MRGIGHPVILREVLATQRDELVLSWMVDHFVANDARRGLRTVLVDIVAKVGEAGVPAGHQHFGDAVERVADLAEELVFRANAAVMPASEMPMLMHFALHDLLGAELKYLCRLVVDERDGVEEAHVGSVHA